MQEIFALSEQRRLRLRLPAAGTVAPSELAQSLRKPDTKNDLTGKLMVLLPQKRGILYINGKPRKVSSVQDHFSGRFASGTFRIEWYDSATRRRFGETTDLLPFTTKTVSLKRFESGH